MLHFLQCVISIDLVEHPIIKRQTSIALFRTLLVRLPSLDSKLIRITHLTHHHLVAFVDQSLGDRKRRPRKGDEDVFHTRLTKADAKATEESIAGKILGQRDNSVQPSTTAPAPCSCRAEINRSI